MITYNIKDWLVFLCLHERLKRIFSSHLLLLNVVIGILNSILWLRLGIKFLFLKILFYSSNFVPDMQSICCDTKRQRTLYVLDSVLNPLFLIYNREFASGIDGSILSPIKKIYLRRVAWKCKSLKFTRNKFKSFWNWIYEL